MSKDIGQQFTTHSLGFVVPKLNTEPAPATRPKQTAKATAKPVKLKATKKRNGAHKTSPSRPAKNEFSGAHCLVLKPGSRSPEAEGIAWFNYDTNELLLGAGALPPPENLAADKYVAWLRKPKNGVWRSVPLTAKAGVWTGHDVLQNSLTNYDRLVVTAEVDETSDSPYLRNCVLTCDINATLTHPVNGVCNRAGRHCISLTRTIGAPPINGVAYINYITGVLLLVAGSMPTPDSAHPGAAVWRLWLHKYGGDTYRYVELMANDNGTYCAREQIAELSAEISDIVISAEFEDATEPLGRRVLVADLDNSYGPL